MKHLSLLIFNALICFSAYSTTIYVDANATGTNSGANWDDAFDDLQDAIALSSFGDEIWVAQGTYKPTSGTSRTIYFNIKNGTNVYGGFSGVETALDQRDVEANETILSAEIGSGSATDNSYYVTYFNNVANQTRLDGFTITSAYNTSGYGGGARVIASSPVIANCIFQGNYAGEGGGAINHSTSGVLTLDHCVFNGNVGNTYGGGALRLYTGTVNISDCYFKSNQSDTYGGAMFIYGAIVNISNSVFAGNISQTSGSVIRVSDVGTLHLSNSLVIGNYTSQTGAITSSTFSNTSAHTIKNCTIVDNKQDNSGGSSTASTVALNDEASITNSIIYGNLSTYQVLGTGLTFNYNITEEGVSNATGSNVLYTNPNFVLPGDVNSAPFDTTGLDYQLDLLSEGIDAGSNANVSGLYDLAGNDRIHNSTVDLGAFENSFCLSTSEFTIPAPYAICGGVPITLEVNEGVSYLWSTGNTSESINVNSSGNYTVVFEDVNGCRGNLTANVTSSPNPTPSIVFELGNLNVGSYTSHQWYFNDNLIDGSVNSTHAPIEGYGLYEAEVQTGNGCEGTATYCLSPATLSADGPTEFCEGEEVVLTVADGNSYVWSTGSLSPSITVNSSDTYTVTVLNSSAGCSVVLEQEVVVNSNPIPVVSFDGQDLTTTTFSSYQWSFNGAPIAGANSQTLDPTENGNGQYSVTVTSAGECENISSVFDLTGLSIKNYDLSSIEFYPNPIHSGSALTIEFNKSLEGLSQIELYNTAGQVVLKTNISASQNNINLPQLESGLYFIKLINSNQNISGLKLTVY